MKISSHGYHASPAIILSCSLDALTLLRAINRWDATHLPAEPHNVLRFDPKFVKDLQAIYFELMNKETEAVPASASDKETK